MDRDIFDNAHRVDADEKEDSFEKISGYVWTWPQFMNKPPDILGRN